MRPSKSMGLVSPIQLPRHHSSAQESIGVASRDDGALPFAGCACRACPCFDAAQAGLWTMFCETMRVAIDGTRTLAQMDELSRQVWQAHASGAVDDACAQ